jgi:hypothetical protein
MNCANCDKITTNPKFCSRSCSVSFTNKTHPKRIKEIKSKNCIYCLQPFQYHSKSSKKYCSKICLISHKEHKIKTIGFGNGFYHNNSIRKYFISNYGNKCMICNLNADNWNGKPITLIVDHINGKGNDNTLDNLRIICPNCDCQLPTYKAKNKGNSSRSYYIVQK